MAFDALASRLVGRAQEGYSCTLMAYGQTGSGGPTHFNETVILLTLSLHLLLMHLLKAEGGAAE